MKLKFKNGGIVKFQPGGKTYKHNDYYGYINKIQEKAISNPQWFWSDAEDASQARQWLYDNGASAVVDNIYENTPEDIQKTIDYKKLSTNSGTKKITSSIHSAQKNFMDTAGAVGLQSAATTALVVPLVANPIGTLSGIGYGLATKYLTDSTINNFSKGKYSDFAHLLRNNKDWGQTGNTISEFLHPAMIAGAAAGKAVGENLPTAQKLSIPIERWTPKMREEFGQFWRKGLDAIQKWNNTKQNYKQQLEGFRYVDPEIEVTNAPYSPKLMENMQHKIDLFEWIDAAKKATEYWKSKGSFKKSPDQYMGENYDPLNPIHSIQAVRLSTPRIVLDHTMPTSKSYGSGNLVKIGIKVNDVPEFSKISVIGHEIGHRNPLFNSVFKQPSTMTDNVATIIKAESPYYGHDYSALTPRQKSLLKPSIKVNEHDVEFNEGYSDLFGLKTRLFDLYGKTDKYSPVDLLRYKLTKEGRNYRFLQQRQGFKRQLDALNESENWIPNKE